VDQRKSLDYALEDARKATTDLNRLVTTVIPAAYTAAKKVWEHKVNRVTVPVE